MERLQAARLSAEAELLHARDEVDSLHAALRCVGNAGSQPRLSTSETSQHSPPTVTGGCCLELGCTLLLSAVSGWSAL